jgi:phage protein D
MQARRTKVKIIYQGVDITVDLEPYLLDFSFADNEGKADDVQITLQDREGNWHDPWLPGYGDKITASIITTNWKKEGQTESLNCGTFYVDDVDFDGPPDTVKIKALSIPLPAGGKNTQRSRVWENTTLSAIAAEAAAGSGLGLFYDAPDYSYDRVDQIQQTDLSFTEMLAKKEGISVKVTDNQLILYDQLSYESKSSVRTLIKGESDILSYSFKKSIAEHQYKEVEVSYFDEEKKETIKYLYTVPGVEEGPQLKINERVKSLDEAERRAIKAARENNKHEQTGKITLVGDVGLVQGMTVDVNGFGAYDAKYFIETSNHNPTNGYTTEISLRKALEY